MSEELDLQGLLRVQHVPVVQAVDLLGLQALLVQLLQGQKASDEQLQRHQAAIDALNAARADQSKSSDSVQDGTAAPHAVAQLQDQVAALDKRLADLEAKLLSPAAEDASAAADPCSPALAERQASRKIWDDPSAATTASSTGLATETPEAGGRLDAELQGLRDQQQQLVKQLADVAAASKRLQQQLSALHDGKADRADVRDMLADGLKGKADSSAVAQLKAQLSDKADRSELDALLNTLTSSSSDPSATSSHELVTNPAHVPAPVTSGLDGDLAPAPAQPGPAGQAAAGIGSSDASAAGSSSQGSRNSSRRGTMEREAGGDVAQQLSKLQLQLALLQDRLNKKADGQAVADLADGLNAASTQLSDQGRALQDIQAQLAAAQHDLGGIRDTIKTATDTAMHNHPDVQLRQQASAKGAATAGHDRASSASSQQQVSEAPGVLNVLAGGSSLPGAGDWELGALQQQQQQLAALTAKVAAIEATLPGPGSLSNTADNAASAVQQRQQQQPEAQQAPPPRRVTGELPASSKLVQALASQVARLAAQVQALSVSAAQATGAAPALAGDTAVSGDGGQAAALQGETEASAGPASAAEPSTETALGSAAAGGGADAGAFGAELAAELDGRLCELEQFVQELSVIKADQAVLHDLRALLAETATQGDTDQLRQQLNSQQSLLDRLMRQISNSGNTTAKGSRPQSAAGSSQRHSAAVTPEYSFMTAAGLGSGPPHDTATAAAEALGADSSAGLRALQAQLQVQHDSLEHLAEAVSLLATGQAAATAAVGPGGDAPRAPVLQVESAGEVDLAAGRFGGSGDSSVPETPNLRFQQGHAGPLQRGFAATGPYNHRASPPAAAATEGPGARPGAGDGVGRPGTPLGASFGRAGSAQHMTGLQEVRQWECGAGPWSSAAALGPQVTRLKRLLQTGQVGRKMDWFDPVLLQKMAQRLAAIDAMLRSGSAAGAASGLGGPTDVEAQLKRLAAEVRQLRDRMAELAAAVSPQAGGQGGWRALGQAADGDHSMLSGKPLGGYRCMACDRPLGALDTRPGPHLPTGQLPVSLTSGTELAAGAGLALGKLPPARTASHRGTAEAVGTPNPSTPAAAADPLNASSPDAGRRVVGPQNWYTAVHGLPAEQLPGGDVGPHLPPGGWRGTQPLRGEEGAVLPLLRGGSSAGGGGGTPRGGAAGVAAVGGPGVADKSSAGGAGK